MQGIQIRIARIKRGLRQVEVAEMVGISQPALSRIERNMLKPSKGTLKRIMHEIQRKDT